tara:strand:+ start:7651 stop:8457 length:807 start_codon:yes stop_codon:yes gene_type:complete
MLIEFFARRLVAVLTKPLHVHGVSLPANIALLQGLLRPGDVLLVEGYSRISTAIKYLTQSTWSHAAVYVGDVLGKRDGAGAALCFVEADVAEGVRAVSIEEYRGLHCRICRPIGLTGSDLQKLVDYLLASVGHQYDLKNIFDLCRYLLPTPPVFTRWRRRMIALGSGDPTRAICSTLIAQAFGAINYPILPIVSSGGVEDNLCPDCVGELFHVRHHSLYLPRDFDVSPYFKVVKPTLEAGFDFHTLKWAVESDSAGMILLRNKTPVRA